MKFNFKLLASLIISLTFSFTTNGQIKPERQWTGFRGYMASGVFDNANLPESFDFQKMINVKWKIELPGLGLSSPVIWSDKLFITTAVSKSDNHGIKTGIFGDGLPVSDSSIHDWKVFCIDKNTGKTIWERTSCTGIPKIRRHPKSTHANAYGIVVCIDANSGKVLYNAKLGNSNSFIASPVASDGKLYIVDEQGTIYIIKDGITFKKLAEIPMNDICLTAPAITDGMIFFRTQKYLIAVGNK